jgi:peptide/nickel transport system substrate-binding protein
MRVWIIVALLLVGCAPSSGPARPAAQADGATAGQPPPQKPMVLAFSNEPTVLEPSFFSGPGNRDFSALLTGYLAYFTPQQQPVPYLADELPTIEKGTWKVLPDGGMQTTYPLKRTATWHDGRPLRAQDYVFAFTMHTDPAVPVSRADVEKRMRAVQALDDHTLFIDWKEPYLWAGTLFGPNFPAAPSHLLEDLYHRDKNAFVNSAHWSTEFVSTGPYKLEHWEHGIEMMLRAHDGFALGRPKLDRIIVKFIPDQNAIVANLLAGAVDLAFHTNIGVTQAQALENAGFDGVVQYFRGTPKYLEFQQRDWGNLQRAVLDVRARRAMLHAIDRQAIVDSIYRGNAVIMHFWLSPDDPAYAAVDRAVTKYDYDPPRAIALLTEAGWSRGADGTARSAAGEVLGITLWHDPDEIEGQEAAVVADYWKAVGIASETYIPTRQQLQDRELQTKYPGVVYNRRAMGYDSMVWTADTISTAENRWSGSNRNGYVNPTLDQNWRKVLGTVDPREREAYLIEALRAMTADAVVTPTHLQPRAIAVRTGLFGAVHPWVGEPSPVWNSWEWQWK